jgi:hypothetical protein
MRDKMRVRLRWSGLVPNCGRRARLQLIPPSSLVLSPGMGADGSSTARSFLTRPPTGTPRRAVSPGEGLRRPRVARAQKINRLHPLSLIRNHPWRLEAAETV